MTLFEEKEFPAVLSELRNMIRFIKETAALCSLSPDQLQKLELASEEILMNIISYAYPKETPGTILVSFYHDAKIFKVSIKDFGVAFDPTQVPEYMHHNTPLEKRKLGGLGILLAKRSVDHMEYQYIPPHNIIALTIKKLSSKNQDLV